MGDLSNGHCINKDKCDNGTSSGIQHKYSSDDILRDMVVQNIRERMEQLQHTIVKEVDKKLDILIDELLVEVKRCDLQKNNDLKLLFKETPVVPAEYNLDMEESRRKLRNAKVLPEKVFFPCNSLLNDLFEVKHIQTIYHIFIAILLILFINTLVHDFVAHGTFNIGLRPIKIGFGKFHLAIVIWLGMQLSTCAVYSMFEAWLNLKWLLDGKLSKYWNKIWLIGFIAYQIMFTATSVHYVLYFDIPAASSILILMELVRFLMKTHAFVRTNVPRALKGKLKNDDDIVADDRNADKSNQTNNNISNNSGHFQMPSFGTYCYFLFAPTLVYRDNYPRTKFIRWKRVLWNSLEVVGVIFYVSFIFERFLMPYFREFGDSNIEAKSLVLSIFGCMMPGAIAYLCGFYCLLHAWMNAAAEIMQFADRMFYRDWWNASSFDVFYRTWNIVVHDWLYQYIYKDMYEIVFKESKTASALVVFTISAMVHEFILAVAFRFFYPVLFMLFQGLGVSLMFVRNRKYTAIGNIFIWLSMAIGNGILISLYSMEYFARQNCYVDKSLLSEYFVPISWRCNGIISNSNWTMQASWTP